MEQAESAPPTQSKPRYALRVNNLLISVDFYTRVLGFTLRDRDDAHDLAVIVDRRW